MITFLSSGRFLSRLTVPGQRPSCLRVEQILAFSRLFLALTSLGAWVLLPSTMGHADGGKFVLPAYVLASVILLGWLQAKQDAPKRFVLCAHVNDLVWPALLCFLTGDPLRPFYVLFLFGIIAAAFRWGFIETVATSIVSVSCLIGQAAIFVHGPNILQPTFFTSLDTSRLVLRCVFLLMAGTLLGSLAETEKELRAEIALSNHLLSLARVGNRFSSVMQDVLAAAAHVYQGTAVHEIISQNSTGRVFRWEIPSIDLPTIDRVEVTSPEKTYQLLPGYPHTFYMQRNGSGRCRITALDEDGHRIDVGTKDLEMPVPDVASVLVVSHEMGRDWYGRFVVLNARLGRQRELELHFAQHLLRQLAPALYSVYLVRSFRSRAGAAERARVARELHDTTIQSLIGLEMQLEVLRRKTSDASTTAELERLQQILRQEVLNVRELMQSLRPVDIGPHQFLDFVAELVERFCRDTGIAARFVTDSHEVSLPATTCRELVRVVQEGLVNIRRHSGAHSALVRLGCQNGTWKLVIDDDGNGFPFSGRFTLQEMDALRRGPVVIRERVRTVGGDMVLESTPGQGSRLEITIPQKGLEAYG